MKLGGAGAVLLLLTVLPAALFLGQTAFPRAGLCTADGYAAVAFALGSTVKPLLLLLAFYQLVLRVPIPFPSVADVFFVIAYPLLVAALVAFLRAYEEAGFPTGLGFLFLSVGDVLFSYLSTLGQAALDPLVDAMYILSYGALAAGALLQRDVLSD